MTFITNTRVTLDNFVKQESSHSHSHSRCHYATTFSHNFGSLGSCTLVCCEPPDPVNLVFVLVTTLSPVSLSSVTGMDTSVPVTYLLYWDGTDTVVGIHLSQNHLFPVSERQDDVGAGAPSFTLPPVHIPVPSLVVYYESLTLVFPRFSVGL